MAVIPVTPKQYRKAMAFVQCPTCTYDFATDEGHRNCAYGECPYLPEALQLHCPTCYYNFASGEGNPACSDPPKCDFAREVVPARLDVLAEWQAVRGL